MHAGAIAPGTRSCQTRTPSTFFLVREKGGFVRTLRTPLGYVPVHAKKFFYLFKLTSFCTDGRTEEAYVPKSFRAQFKLELGNLTFDSSKITFLSTSLRQGHPSYCVISPPFVRRTHAYFYDGRRNHGHEVTRTKTKLNSSIIDLGSRSTATIAAVQKNLLSAH